MNMEPWRSGASDRLSHRKGGRRSKALKIKGAHKLARRPRPSHQPLPPRWPSPRSSPPPPPWRWGSGTRMRLQRGGADEGPSGDQLEASHQDGQGSHSGDGVSLQVPGECSCRRPSKKADMQPAHAKAVSAKGVTRRPTKSEMPMMVAPMPSTKINDISVGPSRLCRLCP